MCVMYVNKVSAIYLSLETLTCRIKIYFNVMSQFCVQIDSMYTFLIVEQMFCLLPMEIGEMA